MRTSSNAINQASSVRALYQKALKRPPVTYNLQIHYPSICLAEPIHQSTPCWMLSLVLYWRAASCVSRLGSVLTKSGKPSGIIHQHRARAVIGIDGNGSRAGLAEHKQSF